MNNINFKNLGGDTVDLYVYGEIVNEKAVDFWTGAESKTDVDITEFKEAVGSMSRGQVLNMYVNSPGGNIFVASAMCSMIQRAKENGVTINAYVDGIAASAASFLIMAADTITMYQNSMMMVHKPMCMSFGNANELQKDIDTLNQIEDNVIMPLYRNKAKCTEEELKQMINDETWLSAEEALGFFNVNLSEQRSEYAAFDRKIFAMYRNAPEALTREEPKAPIDYSMYESAIAEVKKGVKA